MKDFLKKQREIIIVLAYVVIVAALIYFAVLPLISHINTVRDQIQEEKMKQEISGQRLKEIPKIEQQYSTLQKDEGLVDVLLDSNNAVVLIEKLEKLAKDTGNNIEISIANAPAVKIAQPAKGKIDDNVLINSLPSTDYLQIKIILAGNYNSMVNFIQALESSEYYSDIIGIRITKNDPENNSVPVIRNSNLFSVGGSASSEQKITDKINPGDLETSLDVVFYTKNK